MVLGQALVAGSVVQGAKLRPWVKPRQSMVQGAKPRPRVNSSPAEAWSGEQNRAPGSPLPRPSMVLASEIQKGVKNKHMKDGFIKVAAATPKIKVADPAYNTEEILKIIDETEKNGASILVFSELTISGYTCGDLFLQQPLLTECKNQLLRIVKATENKSMLVVVGCPIVIKQKLYNCAVVISDGSILGIVPKTHLPNYSEFYEARHFAPGEEEVRKIRLGGKDVPFGMNLLFCCENMEELVII